jgi:hypothetical protein
MTTTHDHITAARDRMEQGEAEHWKAAQEAADELDAIDRIVYGDEFVDRQNVSKPYQHQQAYDEAQRLGGEMP